MRFWRHLTGAIAGVSAGALYGWSALAAPLQQAYQVRAAEVGQVFSFALLSFTLAVVVAPLLRRRLGTNTALAISAAAAGLFTALAAFAPNFTVFIAVFSFGFGATSGLIYSTTIDMAARSSSPRIATPVFVALFGLGGVIFGPLWKVLVAADWGLKGLLPLSGLLLLASLLSVVRLVTGKGSWGHGATASSASPAVDVFGDEKSMTQPARPSLLLHIWLIFASGAFAGLMVLGLAAKIIDAGPSSLLLTSAVLAGVAFANTAGRLSGAVFGATRDSPLAAMLVSAVLTQAGLIGAALADNALTLGAGLILIAGGYGLLASAVPMLTAGRTRTADFQQHYGLVFTAWGAAGFVAPWLSGVIFDRYGDFGLAYGIAAATTLVSVALVWAFRRRP